VVTDVREGSPAAKSGLQSGDVIVEFDGVNIGSPRDLQGRVERASLTDAHKLVVIRDGNTMTLDVNVQAMPANLTVAGESGGSAAKSLSEFEGIGLQLSDLTADVAKQLGMDGVSGVVITGVKPGSAAEKAGLEDGMVISKVGQTEVKNLDDFGTAMKSASVKDGVLMLVRAGESSRFVVVKS